MTVKPKFLKVPPKPEMTDASEPTWSVAFDGSDGLEPGGHLFQRRDMIAINAAIAARRPLLVRGEPGTGKSQLARAAAVALGRALIRYTVDASTETRDLRFTIDDVARLAEAQVQAALHAIRPVPAATGGKGDKAAHDAHRKAVEAEVKASVAIEKFVNPGPLWWAFQWNDAKTQAATAGLADSEPTTPKGWTSAHGCVLLIDEIDKADGAIPNGLLDALGERQFAVPGDRKVCLQDVANPPLVVITTNEERALPDAFIRRCFVLPLALPEDRDALIDRLTERGRQHFPKRATAGSKVEALSDDVLQAATQLIADDRLAGTREGRSRRDARAGTAELIDLLRAVSAHPASKRLTVLAEIAEFVVQKHRDPRQEKERR